MHYHHQNRLHKHLYLYKEKNYCILIFTTVNNIHHTFFNICKIERSITFSLWGQFDIFTGHSSIIVRRKNQHISLIIRLCYILFMSSVPFEIKLNGIHLMLIITSFVWRYMTYNIQHRLILISYLLCYVAQLTGKVISTSNITTLSYKWFL